MKINVGIIGTSSLTAEALLKIILNHNEVNITTLVSYSQIGKNIKDVFPHLQGLLDKEVEMYNPKSIVENCDLVFLCKSHGDAEDIVPELVRVANKFEKTIKFIDLSADFRLKKPMLYKKWYGYNHHHLNLLKDAVYGLPELYADEIKSAFLVANPGCYPTSVILGVAPLIENEIVDTKNIMIDAYSGVSGAGKTPSERNLAVNVQENIVTYKVGIHQHIPEMEQELSCLANSNVSIVFVPHVLPFKYGILTTMYLKLNSDISWEKIKSIYDEYYDGKPFVRIMDKNKYPEIKNVVGTNFCDIGINIDSRTNTCVVITAIDNLIKGASGQAVQNMNLMFGFNEVEGLPYSHLLTKEEVR